MATIEELELDIKELKSTISIFKENETKKQKMEYDSVYDSLRNSILKTQEIENIIDETFEKLGIADLLGDIIVINNPYSNKLGFKFISIIEEKIKSILLTGIPDNKDKNGRKNRFLRIIKKVINNPIADAILNSNPISGVVSNVINAASNFIDTTYKKIETTKIGNGLKKIAIVTKDEITNQKLKTFKESIQKYSDFYSKMLKATQQFDTKIDILKDSFNTVYIDFNDYYNVYLKKLGANKNNPFKKLDSLFEKAKKDDKNFNYLKILQKKEIIIGLEFIKTIPDAEIEANRYSKEFAKIFNDFIEEYVKILKIPISEKWTKDEIDIVKVNKQIKKLTTYLKNNIEVKKIATMDNTTRSVSMAYFSDNLTRYA